MTTTTLKTALEAARDAFAEALASQPADPETGVAMERPIEDKLDLGDTMTLLDELVRMYSKVRVTYPALVRLGLKEAQTRARAYQLNGATELLERVLRSA